MTQIDQLLATKWYDVQDIYLLSTAHDDWMPETPKLRGSHERTKPDIVFDCTVYKIGVNKSYQIFSYDYFQISK